MSQITTHADYGQVKELVHIFVLVLGSKALEVGLFCILRTSAHSSFVDEQDLSSDKIKVEWAKQAFLDLKLEFFQLNWTDPNQETDHRREIEKLTFRALALRQSEYSRNWSIVCIWFLFFKKEMNAELFRYQLITRQNYISGNTLQKNAYVGTKIYEKISITVSNQKLINYVIMPLGWYPVVHEIFHTSG